jgi:hypothetical protein
MSQFATSLRIIGWRRLMTKTLVTALACAGLFGVMTMPAEAQIKPEIGAAAVETIAFNFDEPGPGRRFPELQLHIATPLTDTWALAGVFSINRTTVPYETRVEGEYGMVFKRYSAPKDVASPFFSVGLLGRYSHRQGRFGTDVEGFAPMLPTIGGGVRARINSRLAVEAGGEAAFYLFVPVFTRLSVGVAVPIGRTTPQRSH